MKKIDVKKECAFTLLTLLAAIASSIALHYFVYPADFAPSGVDGIATMLQEITAINAGYFSLMFNIPMLMLALFILKKRYVIYTLIFTLFSSVLLVILELISFPQYDAAVADGLIAAVFSGVILGVRTGLMLKLGASTGGADIIAGLINEKRPYLNVERIIAIICYGIILASYFVYRDVTSIFLSFIQMFIFDRFAASMLRDRRHAVEVTIVTKEPESIKDELIYKLKHGATVISSRGMYTDGESSVILSVINIRQIPEFLEIMKGHPGTFTYYGELMGVKGNFRWKKDDAVR